MRLIIQRLGGGGREGRWGGGEGREGAGREMPWAAEQEVKKRGKINDEMIIKMNINRRE